MRRRDALLWLALARELVETLPDIVLAVGLPAALAARAATRTIPIIAVSSFPIEAGLVASLARPGGNLSGVSIFTAELNLKRLAILHEVVPAARRMALLRDPALAPPEHMAALAAAARDLGISLDVIEVRQPDEIAAAFRRARAGDDDAVNLLASPIFSEAREAVAASAIATGLPTIGHWREMAEAGCLVSYGPTLAEVFQAAAQQIERILRGARVGELPVEQPTRFQLVINQRTASALGLAIPPAILAQADEVIE